MNRSARLQRRGQGKGDQGTVPCPRAGHTKAGATTDPGEDLGQGEGAPAGAVQGGSQGQCPDSSSLPPGLPTGRTHQKPRTWEPLSLFILLILGATEHRGAPWTVTGGEAGGGSPHEDQEGRGWGHGGKWSWPRGLCGCGLMTTRNRPAGGTTASGHRWGSCSPERVQAGPARRGAQS